RRGLRLVAQSALGGVVRHRLRLRLSPGRGLRARAPADAREGGGVHRQCGAGRLPGLRALARAAKPGTRPGRGPLMKTQSEKSADFAALHAAPGAFVAPNPWDPGSARILAALGFQALTTTSSGFARSLGSADHAPGRAAVLEHVRALAAAV